MTSASDDLVARDRRVVWHPYTQHATEAAPLAVVGASGARLELADGRQLIDAISSWWTILHGHGEPRLVAALERQARTLDHVLFAGATHEPAVRLAEQLVAAAPLGPARVFYSDNGSTAVEVALKIALQSAWQRGHTERRVFVALEGSYHGDTFGAMAVGDPDPYFEPFRPYLFEVRRVAADALAVAAACDELGARCAGVLVEPLVQGAGGMLMYSPAVLRAIADATQQRGLPLIADEVMTGFGRTGALFACELAGVSPDILCLAKGLTGGILPLAVTMAKEELFQAFWHKERSRALFHGHSFTANPLGCAVALESMELGRERNVPARLESIGARLEARIQHLRAHPAAADLRRTGGIVALELRAGDPGYLSTLGPRLRAAAIERGVLLRPLGNVLYAMPPAALDDGDLERVAACFEDLVELAAR